jgi:hypothetical protein
MEQTFIIDGPINAWFFTRVERAISWAYPGKKREAKHRNQTVKGEKRVGHGSDSAPYDSCASPTDQY